MPPPQAGQVMAPSISRSPPTSGRRRDWAWTPDGGTGVLSALAASARTPANRARSPARRTAQRAQTGHPHRQTLRVRADDGLPPARLQARASSSSGRRSAHPGAVAARRRDGRRLDHGSGLAARTPERRRGGPSFGARLAVRVGANAARSGRSRTRASAEGRPAPHQGVSPATRSLGASARPATPRSCASPGRRRRGASRGSAACACTSGLPVIFDVSQSRHSVRIS